MNHPETNARRFTPHFWAALLVCATFPLIWVGGLVTTTEAGMAVPDWPTTYGYNMFAYPLSTWLFGPWDLFVEHGHRLLGSVTGVLTIALCLALWRFEERRWVRWLGIVTLAAVIAQGVLGGMRVVLDQKTLAMIHGCTGPAFFALATVMAAVTSRWWRLAEATPRAEDRAGVFSLAIITSALAYAQLMLGAQLRHVSDTTSPGAFRGMVLVHLLVAVVLTAYVATLTWRVARHCRAELLIAAPTIRLAVMITLQLFLGAGTWVLNYQWPGWLGENAWSAAHVNVQESLPQVIVTTSHMAIGSLIVVNAVLLAVRSGRLLSRPARKSSFPRVTALGVSV